MCPDLLRDATQRTLFVAVVVASGCGAANAQDAPSTNLRTDSRAPYVHRITLYDHSGTAIDPHDPQAPPYSPSRTCGKCHEVGTIAHGWHFNAGEAGVDPGRPGEPWLLTEPRIGTVLPLSERAWDGTIAPADVGLSHWEMTRRFGRQMPGGGFGKPPASSDPSTVREPLRWTISGDLEIDCMVCHSATRQHDPAELARQIARENFRYAPTAALGLAVIRGDARKLPDDFDPDMPPNPDFPDQQAPRLLYDRSRFDADDRVLFDVTRRPAAERCYFCHTQRRVGPDAPQVWQTSRDVHLAAGLACTDCHRNGIDHHMVRGDDRANPAEAPGQRMDPYSCRGCHLGETHREAPIPPYGGTGGAPHPRHPGMPPIHFEKLTCTACHAGDWPEWTPGRVQTAMAHALGTATRDRSASTPPEIFAPIFARQKDGRIAPMKLVWPAYFGVRAGNSIRPLPIAQVEAAAKKLKIRAKAEAAENPLTDDEIASMLTALAGGPADSAPVYLRDGSVYERLPDGSLRSGVDASQPPYVWPLAHDVRPATQSLGVRGCTDCHAADAPMYAGAIASTSSRSPFPIVRMHELHTPDTRIAGAWNGLFTLRSAFKWLSVICVAMLGLGCAQAAARALVRSDQGPAGEKR